MVDSVEVLVTEAAQVGDKTALSELVAAHGSSAVRMDRDLDELTALHCTGLPHLGCLKLSSISCHHRSSPIRELHVTITLRLCTQPQCTATSISARSCSKQGLMQMLKPIHRSTLRFTAQRLEVTSRPSRSCWPTEHLVISLTTDVSDQLIPH